jgi:hypothetical protein
MDANKCTWWDRLNMRWSDNNAKNNNHSKNEIFLVYLVCFISVLLFNLYLINMPPVWDAAAGVFAPAIFLYENQTNLIELLNQPNYLEAGPNTHSFGLITWVTYLVIELSQGQVELYVPILHLSQFLMSAITLTATYYISKGLLGRPAAVFITLSLLLFPLYLVQTGFLYAEIPGATFSILAIISWSKRRFRMMVIFSILACLTKSFGIVLLAMFIPLILLDKKIHFKKRFNIIACFSMALLIIEYIKMMYSKTTASMEVDIGDHISHVIWYLNTAYDIKFLLVISIVAPIIYFVASKKRAHLGTIKYLSSLISTKNQTRRLWLPVLLFPMLFLIFIFAVPLSGKGFFPLIRYYVWIFPCLIITSVGTVMYVASDIRTKITTPLPMTYLLFIISISTLGYLIYNRNGSFYPGKEVIQSFSVAERSFEYQRHLKFQQSSVLGVANLGTELPIFVTRVEYYLLSNSLMGYVGNTPKNVKFILSAPYKSGDLNVFPDEFIVLDSNRLDYHGHDIIQSVLSSAAKNPSYEVSTLDQQDVGGRKFTIYKVRLVHTNVIERLK